MTKATSRNTRKTSAKATSTALYQADQAELATIKRNIINRPSNSVTLTQLQLDHYQFGDGLFIYGPDGATVAFISTFPDETDSDVRLVSDAATVKTFDNLTDARAKLHLLEMLIVNQNGYLELNEKAVQGLAGILSQVQSEITPVAVGQGLAG